MDRFTHLGEFLEYPFDSAEEVGQAQRIMEGILKARSPRLSEIAREMAGSEGANYKCIQRFLRKSEPQSSLLRLFQEEARFVIGDATEMPRPQAKKTDYLGKLSYRQTKNGYSLLFPLAPPARAGVATPYQGKAIPCHFVSYSSATIGAEGAPATAVTSGPSPRSSSCWATNPWCWIASSVAWN